MHLSSQIKQLFEYKPLEYLLTLPPMRNLFGVSETNFKFEVIGKKGLYNFHFGHHGAELNLTISEVIKLLPQQKYKFEIEFEKEEQEDLLKKYIMLEKIYNRKPSKELKNQLDGLFQKIKNDPRVVNPKKAKEYALRIIKGRFELGEPAIAKNVECAYEYAYGVIGDRFPLGEPTIAENSAFAYWYARDVIKGRWPEAEPEIAKSVRWAYEYALNVIHGRFPLGEPTIAKDSFYSKEYARYVIRGRFELGEPEIKKSENHWDDYVKFLKLKGINHG